jgi:hypothetical protein
MVKVETEFQNGSKSFRLADKRLVKLSKGTLADLMNLIQPDQRVERGRFHVFYWHWRNTPELVAGYENCQWETWDATPRTQHRPYLTLAEFIAVLAVPHDRDLSDLVRDAGGVQWRNATIYQSWQAQHPPTFYYGDKNPVCTTIVERRLNFRAGTLLTPCSVVKLTHIMSLPSCSL